MKSNLNKMQAIVRACVASNPEISKRHGPESDVFEIAAQIRRADIAAAFLIDQSQARSERNLADLDFWWNFTRDELSSQSDECVGFAYDRLMSRQT
jgi:hypothetical protein